MKNLLTLFAFLFVGMMLFAQDPVFSDQEESPELCEPFLAAQYDRSAQTLTIRYESCAEDVAFLGWCGTGICGFGTTNDYGLGANKDRELMVGNFNGTVHYQEVFSPYQEIPGTLTINNLNLNDGVYFVRIHTYVENESKIFLVKFAVN